MSSHTTYLKRDPDTGVVIATIRIASNVRKDFLGHLNLEEIDDDADIKSHHKYYQQPKDNL